MSLILDVKKVLRISESQIAFDDEIQDLIESAKMDLSISGITLTDETDPLIKRAVLCYVKANFGYDNPDAERLQQSYDTLKAHLMLAGDYIGGDTETN